MSGFKNHYKTLELPYFADEGTVKAAYRKLVKLHHPDANGGDDARFKEISDAYGVLSDATKKAAFDAKLKIIVTRAEKINPNKQASHNGQPPPTSGKAAAPKAQQHQQKQQQAKQNSQSQAPSSDVVDRFFHRFLKEPLRQHAPKNWPGNINSWFGGDDKDNHHQPNKGSNKQSSSAPIRGEDVSVETTLPIQQAARGTKKTVHVKHKEPCPSCLTSGLVNDKRCQPCLGEGYTVRKRSIEVKIPAGVQHNAKIRVSGEGGRSPNGGTSGDLYLLIQLSPPPKTETTKPDSSKEPAPKQSGDKATPSGDKPDPPKPPPPPKKPAERPQEKTPPPKKARAYDASGHETVPPSASGADKELDTQSELPISCWDALVGGDFDVATHQGKASLTIPSLTQPGTRLRMAGMGKRYGHLRGDHWVTLTITLPKTLTEEQNALIKLWQQRQKRP